MGYSVRDIREASEEAVNRHLREGHWLVYRHYCAVAREGVLECTGRSDADSIQKLNPDLYDPANAGYGVYVVAPTLLRSTSDSEFDERVEKDKEAFWEFINYVEPYSPLTEDGLLLEFAELADQDEITLEVMLDWVGRFGVLGIENREHRPLDSQGFSDLRGGPMENLRTFSFEARKANAVLRLYEAATDPNGPDVEKLRRYEDWFLTPAIRTRYGPRLRDPAVLQEKALDRVASIVRTMVSDDCYPELYQEGDTFRQGVGFKTLLGAMYLQMMWLMTTTGEVRRCQGPGCNAIITFEKPEQQVDPGLKKNARGKYRTRKDKRFCKPLCRVKNHQLKKRKMKVL
jgi:hypothetical protein